MEKGGKKKRGKRKRTKTKMIKIEIDDYVVNDYHVNKGFGLGKFAAEGAYVKDEDLSLLGDKGEEYKQYYIFFRHIFECFKFCIHVLHRPTCACSFITNIKCILKKFDMKVSGKKIIVITFEHRTFCMSYPWFIANQST